MSTVKIYIYPECGTCKDALRFLSTNRYAVEKINIFETPPKKSELEEMLKIQGGVVKKLFNTTGHVYRDLGLSEKLDKMTASQALDLLAKNGKLIKRPFILYEGKGIIGYKKDEWKKFFKVD